jgi:sugar phosphate isomerase/epimerase
MPAQSDSNERSHLSRRALLTGSATTAAALTSFPEASKAADGEKSPAKDFTFCFNTSTIRGQELSITEEVDIAGKAGYDGIEPWLRKINQYVEEGGSLKDLGKRIADHGLRVESAIGFAKWIVDDDEERAKGLEEARRDMDTLAQIGGIRLAAPPAGATNEAGLDLFKAAERYRALLELGDEMGIVPQVEVWGFSKNLSRLGESMLVAIEAGHPKACLLGDVYHIYRGGSDFRGLGMLSANALQAFHMNDYPADPPRESIKDSDRVYPGDGIAPIGEILNLFRSVGAYPVLSLELFNKTYWAQDPLEVARTGLDKMRAAVANSK